MVEKENVQESESYGSIYFYTEAEGITVPEFPEVNGVIGASFADSITDMINTNLANHPNSPKTINGVKGYYRTLTIIGNSSVAGGVFTGEIATETDIFNCVTQNIALSFKPFDNMCKYLGNKFDNDPEEPTLYFLSFDILDLSNIPSQTSDDFTNYCKLSPEEDLDTLMQNCQRSKLYGKIAQLLTEFGKQKYPIGGITFDYEGIPSKDPNKIQAWYCLYYTIKGVYPQNVREIGWIGKPNIPEETLTLYPPLMVLPKVDNINRLYWDFHQTEIYTNETLNFYSKNFTTLDPSNDLWDNIWKYYYKQNNKTQPEIDQLNTRSSIGTFVLSGGSTGDQPVGSVMTNKDIGQNFWNCIDERLSYENITDIIKYRYNIVNKLSKKGEDIPETDTYNSAKYSSSLGLYFGTGGGSGLSCTSTSCPFFVPCTCLGNDCTNGPGRKGEVDIKWEIPFLPQDPAYGTGQNFGIVSGSIAFTDAYSKALTPPNKNSLVDLECMKTSNPQSDHPTCSGVHIRCVRGYPNAQETDPSDYGGYCHNGTDSSLPKSLQGNLFKTPGNICAEISLAPDGARKIFLPIFSDNLADTLIDPEAQDYAIKMCQNENKDFVPCGDSGAKLSSCGSGTGFYPQCINPFANFKKKPFSNTDCCYYGILESEADPTNTACCDGKDCTNKSTFAGGKNIKYGKTTSQCSTPSCSEGISDKDPYTSKTNGRWAYGITSYIEEETTCMKEKTSLFLPNTVRWQQCIGNL